MKDIELAYEKQNICTEISANCEELAYSSNWWLRYSQASHFWYLGSMIHENSEIMKDMTHIINAGWQK